MIYLFTFLMWLSPLFGQETINTTSLPASNASATPSNDDLNQLFFKANELSKETKYESAIELYQQMINAGHQNGYVYFNMGNAYFRLNLVGKAIASYLQAEQYLPRDGDIQANLAYARSKTTDKLPPEEKSIWHLLFFWLTYLSFQELLWAFSAIISLFIILVIVVQLLPAWSSSLRLLQIIVGIVILFVGISVLFRFIVIENSQKAVISSPEVTIKSSKSADSVTLFTLHEGTEVNVIDHQEQWTQISISSTQKGWIPNTLIVVVGN